MTAPDTLSIGDLELAVMLFRLKFATRDFFSLPEHVQLAYRGDAQRLREMIRAAS